MLFLPPPKKEGSLPSLPLLSSWHLREEPLFASSLLLHHARLFFLGPPSLLSPLALVICYEGGIYDDAKKREQTKPTTPFLFGGKRGKKKFVTPVTPPPPASPRGGESM